MYPPNILVTNFCNQNCSFCFAKEEMKNQSIDKEMNLKNFKMILRKMKKAKLDAVKLLGGEPTLHSQFEEIIKLSLRHFPYIQIFTNGIFNDERAKFLTQYFPRIKFTFNVMTPGFQSNKKIREIVLRRIKEFSPKTNVSLSFIIDPRTDFNPIFKTLSPEIIRLISVFQIGLSNPIAGKRNYYDLTDFPKIGNQLFALTKHIRDSGSRARLILSCGFTRCMFSNEQYKYLKKNKVKLLGWGCFGKSSSMDIQTDLSAFHCFPLSSKNRLSFKKNSLLRLSGEFLLKRYQYWRSFQLEICNKCPFYGLKIRKCPGPCIAFRINLQTKGNVKF